MDDNRLKAFERLLKTMEELRELCPWDRQQTFESLRPNTIEETYELADALLEKDMGSIKEELGDLILHVVFYAKMGNETGNFDIADVCNHIVDKLVRRHPHIYGNTQVDSEKEVKNNWEQIKLKEKANKGTFEGVPDALPSLIKAARLQEKASGVGFDWENKQQVWAKIQEELEELAYHTRDEDSKQGVKDQKGLEDEFGDVLFSLINYARFLGIDPDNALEKTNLKFKNRFNEMEASVKKNGKDLKGMNINELESEWQAAKRKTRQNKDQNSS